MLTFGSAINSFNSFKDFNFKFLWAANEIPLAANRNMYFVAETCSHVESRDIVADGPPQVDGGGSNGMGFASG